MLKPGASNLSKPFGTAGQPAKLGPDLQRARAQDTRALILCHIARRDARAVGRLRLLLQHFHAVLTLRMRLAAFRLLALAKRLRGAPRHQSVQQLKAVERGPSQQTLSRLRNIPLTCALAAAVPA